MYDWSRSVVKAHFVEIIQSKTADEAADYFIDHILRTLKRAQAHFS
jgi:hypothetical protein